MPLGRLTIDLEAIASNWRLLADMAAPAECAAVVKADAYGLGLEPVARRLSQAGCRQFYVATLDEGITLRSILPVASIAVLGVPVALHAKDLVEHRLRPVLNHPGDLEAWRRHGQTQPAWMHVDTGMQRLGYSARDWGRLLDTRPNWHAIRVVGVMSHYGCADEPDHPLNNRQRDAAHAAAKAAGLPLSLGNSSGIFLGPRFRGNQVRPGMALYGLNPTPGQANPMRRVAGLEVQVLQVREVEAAGTVGYGASAQVEPGQVLATLGLGYADGFLRALSNGGQVFFRGQAAKIAGRVSMDSIVVDVSELEPRPKPGDWAEIIGPNQSADAIADAAGTIGYEILTSLGHRYARTYKRSESEA